MPGYKGHLIGGFVAFSVTYVVVTACQLVIVNNIMPVITLLLFCLAGALFPDIDTKSKGQKYFYWFILVLLLYFTYAKMFMQLAFLSILATLPMLVKHRGIFHNIWFLLTGLGALCYLLVLYLPRYDQIIIIHMIFFMMGTISHLWLDLGPHRILKIR